MCESAYYPRVVLSPSYSQTFNLAWTVTCKATRTECGTMGQTENAVMNIIQLLWLNYYHMLRICYCVYIVYIYAHQSCIYLIKFIWYCKKICKNSSIVKYHYNIKWLFSISIYFKISVYSCDDKAEFSAAITPVFSVTWCFRNHSNLQICCSSNIS